MQKHAVRDFVLIAKAESKPLYIYVRQNTHITDKALKLVKETGEAIIPKFK
jgi:hypothetical protein